MNPETVAPKVPKPRTKRKSGGKGAVKNTEPESAGDDAINLEVRQAVALQDTSKHGGSRPHPLNFAASTEEATGQDKRTTQRAIAIAKVLDYAVLDKITDTSLDSNVEMAALAKLPAPERAVLVAPTTPKAPPK
ncbi:hypothetical protein [Propionivibrio sp.]|uniref:hypothetical protein n=1 Tax=Propionivibrio sp. TaxID=2212460 RepID=UPI003BF2ED55